MEINNKFSTVFMFQVEKSRNSANRNPDPAVGEGHVHITNTIFDGWDGVIQQDLQNLGNG
jgi:hypothetical protein